MLTLSPRLAAIRFFRDNAYGYSSAVSLANAEQWARAEGFTFDWSDDWSLDHVAEFDCYADGGPETCEHCAMVGPDGEIVASLGCIDDATSDYRRVIEAELADEAQSITPSGLF